jgi:hypothetical protein
MRVHPARILNRNLAVPSRIALFTLFCFTFSLISGLALYLFFTSFLLSLTSSLARYSAAYSSLASYSL